MNRYRANITITHIHAVNINKGRVSGDGCPMEFMSLAWLELFS